MGYDDIAKAYDQFVREGAMINTITVPAVLELCPAPGRVLDVGCGQGALTRELARRGHAVTGIDISSALLEIARQYEDVSPLGIAYVHDDARHLTTVGDETFDGVASNLAVNDIDDLPAMMRSVARVLRPGGWLVYSCMHPCFWAPSVDDPGVTVPGIRPPDYFREGRWWRRDTATGPVAQLGHEHRTIATLLNTLRQAGLVLDHILEPPSDDRPVPKLLVVRAIKLNPGAMEA